MNPLPTQMRDRWENRVDTKPGQGKIYWHILFQDQPQVRTVVKQAQEKLSHFSGFHMTPTKWLHMTALVAGMAGDISSHQMDAMVTEAAGGLSEVEPIQVTLGRVLYHPEAIMLGIRPERALDPILRAVQQATYKATGQEGAINGSLPSWTPHITISYSTARQPAEPIIATLGTELPGCDVLIGAVSLVIQWGPERLWNWEPVGSAQLGTAA